MITGRRISIHSCFFIVCFVIFTLSISLTVYAGPKAQCPCFDAADLTTYAPTNGAVTRHMFIEGEEGSNGDMYVIMRMNYYECEECIVPAECPGIIFGFAATISVDAEPSCGAVMYSEGEVEGWNCVDVGDDFMCVRGFDENSDPIAITTSQYNQCVEILERAEESDRKAVMDGGDQQ